jgi:uncharacterized membrane-anchored protein
LPDTKQAIERLKDITKSLPQFADNAKAFLNTLIFFLNDEQIKIVDEALEKAIENKSSQTKSEKLAAAITKISKSYLNGVKNERIQNN